MPDNKVTLFIDALYKAPWFLVSAFTDINDKWDTWKSIFMNVVDDHFPIKSHRRRKFTPLPWMNDSTIKLIRKRDFCRRASISSKRSLEERLLFEREYKQCRNRVKYSLRKAKAEYFRTTFTSLHSQPHRFWKVVNDLVGRGRERSPPSPSVVSLGRQFASVVGTVDEMSLQQTMSPDGRDDAGEDLLSSFFSGSEQNVLRLLQNLDVKKACGADGIEARFLKAGASSIAASLADLFNVSLSTGKVPNDWKCSRVTPVFKSGDRSDPVNYRPVSLLSSVSKLLEHFVFCQLN